MIVIIALILAAIVVLIIIAARECHTGESLFPASPTPTTKINKSDIIQDIQLSDKLVDMILSDESDFDYSVIKLSDLYVRNQYNRICFYVSNDGVSLDEIGRIPTMYVTPERNTISLRYRNVIDVQKCINDNKPTMVNRLVEIRLNHSSYGYSVTNQTSGRYRIGLDGLLYSRLETLGYDYVYKSIDLKCISDDSLEYLKGIGYE